MVNIMVEEFRQMQRLLAESLQDYETPEFKKLDGRIAHVFDTIYQHEPKSQEEARTMARFVLDLIGSNDTGEDETTPDHGRSALRRSHALWRAGL